jgi:hypothetical protein
LSWRAAAPNNQWPPPVTAKNTVSIAGWL